MSKFATSIDKLAKSTLDYKNDKYNIDDKYINLTGLSAPTNDSLIAIKNILAENEINEKERQI